MIKKPLVLLLCLATALSCLAGCGDKEILSPEISASQPSQQDEPAGADASEALPAASEAAPYNEDGSLKVPFVNTQELSVWDVLDEGTDPMSSALDASLGELLNVSLSYCYATPGSAAEQFSLMAASGDYYDLMYNVGDYYPGGADKAIEDGAIMSLQYIGRDVPNLAALMDQHGDYFKLTDAGLLYQFPVVVEKALDTQAQGLATRKDGLDYLEITSPETYDEFFFLLQMLKTVCGGERGYLLPDDGFSPGLAYGFGAYNGFYQVDDVVKYGFLEQSFKDYMDYVYVLLDKKLAIFEQVDAGYTLEGRISSGWVTCWYGGMDQWDQAASAVGEDAVAGIKYPVPAAGDGIHLIDAGDVTVKGMSVSAKAGGEKFDVITALMNCLYSDEFTVLANCGTEGGAYTYDGGGQMILSDEILTAEDPGQALAGYAMLMNLPHRVNNAYLSAAYTESRSTALSAWTENYDGAYLLPDLDISAGDQQVIDDILAQVTPLTEDFLLGYIQGDYDAYDYEDMRSQIIDLGILDAIDIYQLALTGTTVPYVEPEETLSDKLVPTYTTVGAAPAAAASTAPEASAEVSPSPSETAPAQSAVPTEPAETSPQPSIEIAPVTADSASPAPSVPAVPSESASPAPSESADPQPSGSGGFGDILGF